MQEPIIFLIYSLFSGLLIASALFLNKIITDQMTISADSGSILAIIFKILLSSAFGPIILMIAGLIINYSDRLVLPFLHTEQMIKLSQNIMNNSLPIICLIAFCWFILQLFSKIKHQLISWSITNNVAHIKLYAPVVLNGLKILFTLAILYLLLPTLRLTPYYFHIAEKILNVLLISAITWIVLQVISAGENIAIHRYENKVMDSFKARGIYTQIHILKKIMFILVMCISIALMLMVFDSVKELGTSILASAGLATAIIGFAGQKSIGSILSGFQLALTQPIRIKDQVIVEGEFGEIEEITLTYVVIKLWDLRRLIVPVSYFMEKPFQNWTRTSKDLLVTVFFYFDYTLPIEPLRDQLQKILNQSQYWNKKLGQLQMTDAKDSVIEIRVLSSADDTGSAWNLRCEIREKLITFVREKYPHCLPRTRADIAPLQHVPA